jgi:hypothetical protein
MEKRTLKSVTFEGQFPELKGGSYRQQGRGTGTTLKSAFAAAGRDLFRQKGLKGRRISSFTLTVSVGTICLEDTLGTQFDAKEL